jgi:hypothetical protein
MAMFSFLNIQDQHGCGDPEEKIDKQRLILDDQGLRTSPFILLVNKV